MKLTLSQWGQLFPSIKSAAVKKAIQQNLSQWGEDFPKWANDNQHIIDHLMAEVARVKEAGFDHYSMRTLVEVTRHHTSLRQRDVVFKIQNNVTPDLARLAIILFPELEGFFDLRHRRSVA